MEFGDTSDKEAPPAPPRNKDLLKNMQMQIVAMLQGMVTEFRQPLQVQSHLEMPGILVQLGHIQRT